MKNILRFLCLFLIVSLNSCEKDEGLLPDISFKMGGNYVSSDVTRPGGSTIVIGINAAKTEDKDVLTKFNISKSVNGGTPATVYNKDLSGSEGDTYSYDYTGILGPNKGDNETFTFTVTNRDGLINQISLVVAIE